MLPSVRPILCSMSQGETTWRPMMALFRFGAYSATVFTTASPKASRLLLPRTLGEVIGRVLHEDRHHVLSRRRHGGIDRRRDENVHVRAAREVAVLGLVVGALDVVRARADRDRARAGAGPSPGRHVKLGSSREREVDLAGGAADLEATDAGDELLGQRLLVDEVQERALRVEAGGDLVGLDLLAALERDARGSPVPGEDASRWARSARISTPKLRAAEASDSATAPMPPLAKPQERDTPSISPM